MINEVDRQSDRHLLDHTEGLSNERFRATVVEAGIDRPQMTTEELQSKRISRHSKGVEIAPMTTEPGWKQRLMALQVPQVCSEGLLI